MNQPLAAADAAKFAAAKRASELVETGMKVSEMVVHEDTKKAITSVISVSSEPASPFTSVEGGFDINAN